VNGREWLSGAPQVFLKLRFTSKETEFYFKAGCPILPLFSAEGWDTTNPDLSIFNSTQGERERMAERRTLSFSETEVYLKRN
jgi:hypothetical protein